MTVRTGLWIPVKWYVINVVNFSSWWYLRLDTAPLFILSFKYMLHIDEMWLNDLVRNTACFESYAITKLDVRTCNQLRNLWQFPHLEHAVGQPVILHVPFVTDASTSRLQHVWPRWVRTQHQILHNVLRLSKHDDGESSNKYQSFRRGDELVFWMIKLWRCSECRSCRFWPYK